MTATSLAGIRVLVTRPDPGGADLCQYLEARAASTLHLPSIVFAEPADQAALIEAIQALPAQDSVIYISPQAVLRTSALIRHYLPNWTPSIPLIAVGQGTAHALKAQGWSRVISPASNWSSEGVLDLPELKTVVSKRIAIVRGEGGRMVLDRELALRGAQVLPVIAYRRCLPPINSQDYLAALRLHPIDVVVTSSGEGIKNLKTLVGEAGWAHLCTLPLIVVGERMKRLAEDLDFQRIWVAQSASHDAIVAAISEKRDVLCQIKKMQL